MYFNENSTNFGLPAACSPNNNLQIINRYSCSARYKPTKEYLSLILFATTMNVAGRYCILFLPEYSSIRRSEL